jgi:hypothetical protein
MAMQEGPDGYSIHASPLGPDPEESGSVNTEGVDCRTREAGRIGRIIRVPGERPGSLIISEQTPTPRRNPQRPRVVFADTFDGMRAKAGVRRIFIRHVKVFEVPRLPVKRVHIAAVYSYPECARSIFQKRRDPIA